MSTTTQSDTPPVRKVFTNRNGGVSLSPHNSFNLGDHVGDDPAAVSANRQRLAEILGLDTIVYMEQIHSPTVTEVTADMLDKLQGQPVEASDALVTTLRGIGLAVLTADCVPLLLSDADSGVIAAVHAGRMGARNGIVKRTIARMEELGAVPAHIHALMGAAASGENYELPAEMAADVEKHLPESRMTTKKGTVGVDLRKGITRQLLSLGVRNIDADPRCTIDTPEFYSYRREGKTGRQAGVIWLT